MLAAPLRMLMWSSLLLLIPCWPTGRNAYGVAMFDVKHGVAYTYSLDTEAVFALFTNGKATLATQVLALHLAIVHLNNAALNRRILEYFFAEGSNKLHPRLLKECLLGNSYVSMQQHSDEDEFLRLLPMTSIPTYYEELHGGAAGNDFSQQCPVHYRYSRLDPHALRDGTCGKAIQGDMYVQRSHARTHARMYTQTYRHTYGEGRKVMAAY